MIDKKKTEAEQPRKRKENEERQGIEQDEKIWEKP